MKTSDSIKEISGAYVKFQAKVQNIKKDGKNPFFNNSTYATLEATLDGIRPILAENELAIFQGSDLNDVLITRLIHSSGEWFEGHMQLKLVKGDMQALGSAWTYARRYSLQAMCGVAGTDDDGNDAVANQDEDFKPVSSAQASIQKAKEKFVKPQQSLDPWDTVITFGVKHKGKTFRELGPEGLSGQLWFLEKGLDKYPSNKEHIEQIKYALATRQEKDTEQLHNPVQYSDWPTEKDAPPATDEDSNLPF